MEYGLAILYHRVGTVSKRNYLCTANLTVPVSAQPAQTACSVLLSHTMAEPLISPWV